MREYKPQTIFDLLNEETYNITSPAITDPLQALYWTAKMGNTRATIEYLKITNPAKWDSDSKEYKERIRKENELKLRPILIDFDNLDKFLNENELKEYNQLNNQVEQEKYLKLKWIEHHKQDL